jgi:hypothetical protein
MKRLPRMIRMPLNLATDTEPGAALQKGRVGVHRQLLTIEEAPCRDPNIFCGVLRPLTSVDLGEALFRHLASAEGLRLEHDDQLTDHVAGVRGSAHRELLAASVPADIRGFDLKAGSRKRQLAS